MLLLSVFIFAVGFIACLWMVIGLVLLMFFTPVFVARGTPFSVKVRCAIYSIAVGPWCLFAHGSVPAMLITRKNPSPQEEREAQTFMAKVTGCDCPHCRSLRGE